MTKTKRQKRVCNAYILQKKSRFTVKQVLISVNLNFKKRKKAEKEVKKVYSTCSKDSQIYLKDPIHLPKRA